MDTYPCKLCPHGPAVAHASLRDGSTYYVCPDCKGDFVVGSLKLEEVH